MKMKTILAIALTFSTVTAFADEASPVLSIPQSVLDLHITACPEFTKEEGKWLQRESYKLPKGEYSSEGPTLYVLGCEMFAYNSLEKAYLVDAYSTTLVSVAEVMTDGSIVATSDLMGAGFNPADNTLGTFQKGRGMADCGSSASYEYKPEYSKFVLIEARIKDSCDGEETDWPIVYKK